MGEFNSKVLLFFSLRVDIEKVKPLLEKFDFRNIDDQRRISAVIEGILLEMESKIRPLKQRKDVKKASIAKFQLIKNNLNHFKKEFEVISSAGQKKALRTDKVAELKLELAGKYAALEQDFNLILDEIGAQIILK